MAVETVAHRLVQLLREAGVTVIFGIGGTHSLPFLGALERDGGLRYVPARNEQGAAYMAGAYARRTGLPGVVLTSTGPGALNALSGIADARWSSLPLLHITTYADTGTFSGGIHESPAQSEVARLVGTAAFQVSTHDVGTPFWAAWEAARVPTGAPVTLEIRSALWNEPAQAAARVRPEPGESPPTDDAGLEDLLTVLRRAENPVIFAGGGVLRAGAGEKLLQVAERLGAPVVTSFQGKGIGNWDHPLYLGPWGAEVRVHELFAAADTIVVVGSKVSALSTGNWGLPLAPEKTFRVDVNYEQHGHYPGIRHLRGGADWLCDGLETLPPVAPDRAIATTAAVRKGVEEDARARSPEDWAFLESLTARLTSPDLAIACDMNKASFWIMKYLPLVAGQTHAFSSYLCMGSALPAAIGLAEAGARSVIAVVGDGALQMGMTELATVSAMRYPIVIPVFVNNAYGLLRDNGAKPGIEGSKDLGVDLWNPNYRLLAQAYDLAYETAGDGPSLADACADVSVPTLVEVSIDMTRQW